MNEDEIVDALIKGAVVRIGMSDGVARVIALDDLSSEGRDCFRASRDKDYKHQGECPNCLENEAGNILMDVASHREDGHEAAAQELEAEVEQIRLKAAKIREREKRER